MLDDTFVLLHILIVVQLCTWHCIFHQCQHCYLSSLGWT